MEIQKGKGQNGQLWASKGGKGQKGELRASKGGKGQKGESRAAKGVRAKQVAQASLWSAVPDAPLISFGIVVLR